MLFNVKIDLQLMGFTAREKRQNHLYLSSGNFEFAFLSGTMAFLTGRFSFERDNFVQCVANTK